jgi:hypothetical protein
MARSPEEILREVKALAVEYLSVTGKPLGATGEIAEYEAARQLGVKLVPARTAGYDAEGVFEGSPDRVQIKGRRFLGRSGMLPSIDIAKELDSVMFVQLDERYDAVGIWRAPKNAVVSALTAPGSKARNERHTMAVSKFKSIGKRVWPVV